MALKVRPPRKLGLLISLNHVRVIKTMACRICYAKAPSFPKIIQAKDPETDQWTAVVWPFCQHHLIECRNRGLREFSGRYQLPIRWKNDIAELILTRINFKTE